MKISDHITFAEAIHSNTAKRYSIDNIPNEEQTNNMKILAEKIFGGFEVSQKIYLKNDLWN